MTSIREKIDLLMHKKKRLEEARREVHENRINLDVTQFYEDSMKIANVGNGMAILITPSEEERDLTDRLFDDKKAAQIMINRTSKEMDLKSSGKDLFDTITDDCSSIYISLASVLSEPTVIYLPKTFSQYQIERLNKFNEDVKKFNDKQDGSTHVRIVSDLTGDTIIKDIDPILEKVKAEEIGMHK